jgi:hypothetical protein
MLANMGGGTTPKAGHSTIQGAYASRGYSSLENLSKRDSVQPPGIGRSTWASSIAMVIGSLSSVIRHKSTFHHNVVATRGTQPDHIPVLLNTEV